MMNPWLLVLAFLLLFLVISTLAACTGLRVEGECSYVRTVEIQASCKQDGKLEQFRIIEPQP